MTEEQEGITRSQLENLKRKADQQATAHAWLRDRYRLLNSILSTTSLVAGVFLLAIVMASPDLVNRTLGIPPDWYQWFLALLAAGSFSIVIVQIAWRFDAKSTLHDQAVRHYTKVGYSASRIIRASDTISAEKVAAIQNEYLDDHDLPRIPESKFLPLKQWHLRKVQMSKELDGNPHESLRTMRKRLEAQAGEDESSEK
jgi:hypothetical protein